MPSFIDQHETESNAYKNGILFMTPPSISQCESEINFNENNEVSDLLSNSLVNDTISYHDQEVQNFGDHESYSASSHSEKR